MADFGAVGVLDLQGDPASASLIGTGLQLRIVNCGLSDAGADMILTAVEPGMPQASRIFGGIDTSTSNPPSYKQGRGPSLFRFFWPVQAGARSFSIDVMYQVVDRLAGSLVTTDFPRVRFRATNQVGIETDALVTAPSGHDGVFRTVTYSFTARAKGVVEVWLENPSNRADRLVNWDNISVS